jgi:hypothetical protein
MNMYEEESFKHSIVFTKLKPEIKEWLKNQYNDIDKRNSFIRDIASNIYDPYHRLFKVNIKKYIKNFPLKKHNPTDFLSICLLTMSNNQIDNINEDLSNLDLTKIFTYVEDDYNDNEELSAPNIISTKGIKYTFVKKYNIDMTREENDRTFRTTYVSNLQNKIFIDLDGFQIQGSPELVEDIIQTILTYGENLYKIEVFNREDAILLWNDKLGYLLRFF